MVSPIHLSGQDLMKNGAARRCKSMKRWCCADAVTARQMGFRSEATCSAA
jgi:hypothetical protein